MITVTFFTFNPVQENTYVLHNEKGDAIIIDPGCYFSAEQETLKNHTVRAGLKPVQWLNTHCHFDHIFGAKWLSKEYNLEMYCHAAEQTIMENGTQSALRFGLGFDNYNGPLHFLNPGDIIKLGNDELKVLFTPGHSPGSICFYCKAQNFVIAGDVLFYESIGRTDLPFGNHQQLLTSIQEQLYTLPDETIIYPGHGPATTIEHEKKFNPYVRA